MMPFDFRIYRLFKGESTRLQGALDTSATPGLFLLLSTNHLLSASSSHQTHSSPLITDICQLFKEKNETSLNCIDFYGKKKQLLKRSSDFDSE